jgi:S-adenosylmethionine:tRNA ribosyltransferase-isomerase
MFETDTIRIKDYNYDLPAEQVAQFPLPNRDASKLLIYSHGLIREDVFSNIGLHLPANSLLVFNNTRVIHARLVFRKPTGSQIEIFCLEPLAPSPEIQAAFLQQRASTWKCLVGNLKRWKSGTLSLECTVNGITHLLSAALAGDCGDGSYEIEFHWNPPEKTFSEILELMGLVPLPPYINRPAEPSDNDRYQTIYAACDGSVAAPTAGLHFTASLLEKLNSTGIDSEKVTLHVGVGTFRPVSVEHISGHIMHHERIVVRKSTIERLVNSLDRPMFAVGTTTARTLESLYWLGVRLLREGSGALPLVQQWDPYKQIHTGHITPRQALGALTGYLEAHQLEEYSGETQLMIVPGYQYKLLSGLITNFHMPQSTLLLLVAAMIGDDWRKVYEYALQNGFRFLSYGDSCIFFNPRG